MRISHFRDALVMSCSIFGRHVRYCNPPNKEMSSANKPFVWPMIGACETYLFTIPKILILWGKYEFGL